MRDEQDERRQQQPRGDDAERPFQPDHELPSEQAELLTDHGRHTFPLIRIFPVVRLPWCHTLLPSLNLATDFVRYSVIT